MTQESKVGPTRRAGSAGAFIATTTIAAGAAPQPCGRTATTVKTADPADGRSVEPDAAIQAAESARSAHRPGWSPQHRPSDQTADRGGRVVNTPRLRGTPFLLRDPRIFGDELQVVVTNKLDKPTSRCTGTASPRRTTWTAPCRPPRTSAGGSSPTSSRYRTRVTLPGASPHRGGGRHRVVSAADHRRPEGAGRL